MEQYTIYFLGIICILVTVISIFFIRAGGLFPARAIRAAGNSITYYSEMVRRMPPGKRYYKRKCPGSPQEKQKRMTVISPDRYQTIHETQNVLTIIDEIASQMNILELSAAMESTRANDTGQV